MYTIQEKEKKSIQQSQADATLFPKVQLQEQTSSPVILIFNCTQNINGQETYSIGWKLRYYFIW